MSKITISVVEERDSINCTWLYKGTSHEATSSIIVTYSLYFSYPIGFVRWWPPFLFFPDPHEISDKDNDDNIRKRQRSGNIPVTGRGRTTEGVQYYNVKGFFAKHDLLKNNCIISYSSYEWNASITFPQYYRGKLQIYCIKADLLFSRECGDMDLHVLWCSWVINKWFICTYLLHYAKG